MKNIPLLAVGTVKIATKVTKVFLKEAYLDRIRIQDIQIKADSDLDPQH